MPHLKPIPSAPAERGEFRRFRPAVPVAARRLVLRAGIVLASFGLVLVAASQSRPDLIASRLGLPGFAVEGKSSVELANLAGFQRRGNSLVGEVKTRDGATMRLVFDARTHALIGLRVLDPAPEAAPREAEAARACLDTSSVAPLPESASPAN